MIISILSINAYKFITFLLLLFGFVCILLDFDSKFFWKWTDFQSYVDFMLLFAFVGAVVMYLLIDVPIFVESVGLLALLTEAMLGVPQFIRNFNDKSTEGMRYIIDKGLKL